MLAAWLLAALCAGLAVCAAAAFLPHQAIWGDEVTQLSGLTLGPLEVVRWLSGDGPGRFGVPDDRMPPLSYWAGRCWRIAAGDSQTALRWMGVLCVAAATVLVFFAAARAFGLAAGVAAGLLFGLSPNVAYQAVEIRAYPLFLLCSAAGFYFLTALVHARPGRRARALAGLACSGVLAFYTHYFGLMLAFGLWIGALAALRTQKAPFKPALWGMGVSGLAALGLIPMVLGALQVSSGSPGRPGDIHDILQLLYRLCVHPAMWMSPAVTIIALVAFALLGNVAAGAKRGETSAHKILALALAAGFAPVLVANFILTGLEVARPPYSDWMLPGLSIFIASAIAAKAPLLRRAAYAATATLIACYAYGDYQLARHGAYFAHTPFNQLRPLVESLGPEKVAIVHDQGSEKFRGLYWPLYYTFGAELPQYLALENTAESALRVTRIAAKDAPLDPDALQYDYVVVMRSMGQRTGAIVRQIHHGDKPLGEGPVARTLDASRYWEKIDERLFISYVASEVDVFQHLRIRQVLVDQKQE